MRVLVVEMNRALRGKLRRAAQGIASVSVAATAPAAKVELVHGRIDWLVTNIRLGAFNGLHLAYLAKLSEAAPQILVYSETLDLLLAREAQQLGAFYEPLECVVFALPAYLRGTLPPNDRRDPAVRDRRLVFRGGRRRTDGRAMNRAATRIVH